MKDTEHENPHFIYLNKDMSVNKRISKMVESGLYDDVMMRPVDIMPDDIIVIGNKDMIAGDVVAIVFGNTSDSDSVASKVGAVLGKGYIILDAYKKVHVVAYKDRGKARDNLKIMHKVLDDMEALVSSASIINDAFDDAGTDSTDNEHDLDDAHLR